MYNEEEQNNINEIDKILNEGNEYVRIAPGSSKILKFNPSKKIEPQPREYNEKPFIQIQFRVFEQNQNGDNQEKSFDVGKKSARLIIAKLKEGYTLLKIERIGSGKDTMYIPTIAESTN